MEGIALKETVDVFINIFLSEKEIALYQEQHTLRENPDVDREYVVSNFGEIQAREQYTRIRARFGGHPSLTAHVLLVPRDACISPALLFFAEIRDYT